MGTTQTDYLLNVVLQLSQSRDIESIINVIRQAGRKLAKSDGATFILKDHDKCYYVDENAISPLWKGKRFPIEDCISGWAMLNKSHTVIRDIYKDNRIPINAYAPTFVKSLVMVPINLDNPIGAIGNYWGHEHEASDEEVELLSCLAAMTAISLQHLEVLNKLEHFLFPNKEYSEFMNIVSYELNAVTNYRVAISNEIERLSTLIKNEKELKKVIYEISLKQLSEMDQLVRDFLRNKVF